MIVLGIGGSDHDFSAALVKDGKLLFAIEDERLSRIKHGNKDWNSYPGKQAVEYVLDAAKITIGDVDHIYSNLDLIEIPGKSQIKSKKVGHHFAHACSVYYGSPFDQASILIIDGNGHKIGKATNNQINVETISFGSGKGTDVKLKPYQTGLKSVSTGEWHFMCSNSLGSFYKVVTELLGHGMRGQGKVMGLACYGSLKYLEEMKEFAYFNQDTESFTFDPYSGIKDWALKIQKKEKNKFQVDADIAMAAQCIFEESLINLSNILYKKNPSLNLVYSGGCALNSSANYRLKKESSFDNLFIFPASGDNGLAIGCAYHGYYMNSKKKKSTGYFSPYTGKEYDKSEIEKSLSNYSVSFNEIKYPIKELVSRLLEGQVIGIFTGGSEIGPRALGHRSIIADPRKIEMRDKINLKIKNRESYRPLAPIIPLEALSEYFEGTDSSPYMLSVLPIKESKKTLIKGVCHVDGSARVQTITQEQNSFLYDLLRSFGDKSGVPILINTSFNSRGEPIVETPDDAIKTFMKIGLDLLVINKNIFIERHTPYLER